MAKVTSFGHGAGCDFVEKPCIGKNDTLPDYMKDFFCNATDTLRCDPSHHVIANCDLHDLSEVNGQAYPPIPQVFRNFDNPVSNN